MHVILLRSTDYRCIMWNNHRLLWASSKMYHQRSAICIVSTVLNNFRNDVSNIVFLFLSLFYFRNPLRSPVLHSAIEVCCLLSATVWSWCLLLGDRVGASSWMFSAAWTSRLRWASTVDISSRFSFGSERSSPHAWDCGFVFHIVLPRVVLQPAWSRASRVVLYSI